MGMFLSRLELDEEGRKEWSSRLLVIHGVGASVKPLTDGVTVQQRRDRDKLQAADRAGLAISSVEWAVAVYPYSPGTGTRGGTISKVSQEFASCVTLTLFDDKLRIDRQCAARGKHKAKTPLVGANPTRS